MNFPIQESSPASPMYSKAVEIFTISRNIASYLVEDFSMLQDENKEHPDVYFTGDMVQQSVSLGPEILRAEQKTFSEEKYKHVASIDRLTNLLYRNCERLEKSNSNGKDFLPVLRKELKKFRKLQHTWMLTL